MRSTGARPRRSAEAGVSLIELVVAAAILGILMGAVATTLINTLHLSRANANRTVAANLAAQEVEALRALEFSDLEALEGDATLGPFVVEDREFFIDRSVYWSSNEAEGGPCEADAGPADENVLRIDLEVTWHQMRGVRPVETSTTVSPPIGEYEPGLGSLTVYVMESGLDPDPIGTATVTVVGPAPSTATQDPKMTSAEDGCVLYTDLEAGDYTITVSKPGYVSPQHEAEPTRKVGVKAATRTSVEFTLGPAWNVSLDLAVHGGVTATTPDGPVDVHLNDGDEVFALGTDDDQPFPVHPGTHHLFVANCPAGADPGIDVAGQIPAPPSGSTATTGTAVLGPVDVVWADETLPDPLRELTVHAQHMGECGGADPDAAKRTLDVGTITPGEDVTIALPWGGPWRVFAREDGSELLEGDTEVTLDPGQGTPEVVFDLDALICVPLVPLHVGTTTQNFTSTSGSSPFTVNLPSPVPPPLPGDLVVVTVNGGNLPGWAPVDETGWSRIPSDLSPSVTAATWTRIVQNGEQGTGYQFHRPSYTWLWLTRYETGTVHVSVFRNVDGASPASDGTGSASSTSLGFADLDVPGDEFGLRVLIGDVQRTSRNLTSGQADRIAQTSNSGHGTTLATFWAVAQGNTGPATVSWSGSASAYGHQMLFRGVCG